MALKCSGVGTILDISPLDLFLSTLPIGILGMPTSEILSLADPFQR
jgi:hypothetical protein